MATDERRGIDRAFLLLVQSEKVYLSAYAEHSPYQRPKKCLRLFADMSEKRRNLMDS